VCRAGEIRFQDGTRYFSSSRDLICSEPTVLRETAFTHQLLSNLEKRTSHDRNSIDFANFLGNTQLWKKSFETIEKLQATGKRSPGHRHFLTS
jgi:hypothetical protein